MEYTVKKLGQLAGITPRTLRFYDEIGLLKPARINTSGYRIYGGQEVDRLQQIMFYREFGMELSDIKALLDSDGLDVIGTLKTHKKALEAERERLDMLIDNVDKTILEKEGRFIMRHKEKFEGFKKGLINENERKYGEEIRAKYGEEAVEKSNRKLMNLSKKEYEIMETLAGEILQALETAVDEGIRPDSEKGREIAALHKKWLEFSWPEYSGEAHRNLAQMYVDDERFKKYYDRHREGCALFLRDAVHKWCE